MEGMVRRREAVWSSVVTQQLRPGKMLLGQNVTPGEQRLRGCVERVTRGQETQTLFFFLQREEKH